MKFTVVIHLKAYISDERGSEWRRRRGRGKGGGRVSVRGKRKGEEEGQGKRMGEEEGQGEVREERRESESGAKGSIEC